MRIDIMTLFPDSVDAMLNVSILGRAQQRGYISIQSHQIRQYTTNRQMQVDDYPYGGGRGAVMQADPLYRCWSHIVETYGPGRTIFLSPCGRTFTQEVAKELKARYDHLILVCGHYEGVDQRFLDECVDEEISMGDFVLTGGEIPAMAVADAVCRLVPGVLSDPSCYENESHWSGTLEAPQYSRPEIWHDRAVPPILLSGNHAKVDLWRRKQSLLRTRQRRPDLYAQWCATHPITQIPRWKRTERAQLIKTDAQLDAAAKLFAEGCRTVCRDVCTEAGLAEYTPEAMRQRLEEERKAGWAFYLHTTSDTPDGMVGVCHKTGEIGHLFVTQSARGSGIGTKLLDFARKKLAEHARPWLAVLDVNTAAIGLYRRMGYLPDGVRNMYQPGVDVAFCKPCKELVMRYQPQDQG